MSKIPVIFLPFLLFLLGFFMILYTAPVYADEVISPTPANEIFASQVHSENDLIRLSKENKRCIRCHQKTRLLSETKAITTVGLHKSEEYFDNCTACHQNKNAHPKKDAKPSIIAFDDHAEMPIFTQNQQCINCHTPDALRKSEWTHDVHATKLTCSNCHNMHKERDPIVGISPQFRIGLCATCHENLTLRSSTIVQEQRK
ncbi:MAG: cytochrome C [Psychromonas sp.]